jgi:hypothetical protein
MDRMRETATDKNGEWSASALLKWINSPSETMFVSECKTAKV